jgi:hypothetical protein
MPPNYSGAVLGITGPDPAFRDDDGGADTGVAESLRAFAVGQGSEQEALTILAQSRLLVPVVAVLAVQIEQGQNEQGQRGQPDGRPSAQPGTGRAGEKATDMAMPTLIGLDGRRAIPAFTSVDSMHAWQPDARPVPAPASRVWHAATADSCAVVIDVAGPVPIAVEGARLAALARGEAAPAPCADSDVHEVVSDILAGQLAVAGFELRPGGADRDLVIALTLSDEGARHEVTELAAEVGGAVMERLGARLRRGVAIWLGRAGAPA